MILESTRTIRAHGISKMSLMKKKKNRIYRDICENTTRTNAHISDQPFEKVVNELADLTHRIDINLEYK